MNIRQIVPPLILVALMALLAIELPSAIAGKMKGYDWFAPVIDTRAILSRHYVEQLDDEAMQAAAMRALVESLDDPYTEWVPPSGTEKFQKDLSGQYVGIGAHVRSHEGRLRILSPMEGSPALEAGIRAGDIVMQIDGFDTLDQPVDDIIAHLMGTPGSKIRLLVQRPDGSEEWLDVTRRPISAPTVAGLLRRNGQWQYLVDADRGIAYLRVDQFTMDTVPQMTGVLQPLAESGDLKSLVLDLRNNPGGALPAAVEMAELFLEEGDIVSIASERENTDLEPRTYQAQPGHALESIPLTVLIDDRSASASEIVAGAISDNDRGWIVGERSFGKGSVQEVRPLKDDHGILKFTTAYYYLPSGRKLHRQKGVLDADWGVDPSPGCIVPEDPQATVERLEGRWTWDAITDDEPAIPDTLDDTWIRESYLDPALAEAVALLRHRSDHGAWPDLPEDDDPAYPPMQAELDAILDRREALERHLIELQDEILSLQGSERVVNRGLIGLPEEADVAEAELTLRDSSGNLLGVWQIAEGENIKRTLDAVVMKPVEGKPSINNE